MVHDLMVRTDVDKESPFCRCTKEGKGSRRCRRCANHRGFNRKYGIDLCRRCLHAKAEDIGFKSLD
ncbi:small subunit ribosomal protein S29e [Pancytospora epiphaga]|nr:small subunit ribosomal protein S29e [Pancytospora epiphaga]